MSQKPYKDQIYVRNIFDHLHDSDFDKGCIGQHFMCDQGLYYSPPQTELSPQTSGHLFSMGRALVSLCPYLHPPCKKKKNFITPISLHLPQCSYFILILVTYLELSRIYLWNYKNSKSTDFLKLTGVYGGCCSTMNIYLFTHLFKNYWMSSKGQALY